MATVALKADQTDAPAPNTRRLHIVHAIWLVVIVVDALFFITGVPGLYALLHHPCLETDFDCSTVQAPLADFQVMQQQHLVEVSAIFVLTWYSLGILLAAGAGALFGPRLMRW